MKITFKDKISNSSEIAAGDFLEIIREKVNYIVGLNGSGKSICFSSLARHINPSGNWMVHPPAHVSNKFEFSPEFSENFDRVFHITAKHRQSTFVDLGMAFSSAGGVFGINDSEGQFAIHEFVKAVEFKNDKRTLIIFDEIDSHFDIKYKNLFFRSLANNVWSTTVIVITHDCHFIDLLNESQMVFNFSTGKNMYFTEYLVLNE